MRFLYIAAAALGIVVLGTAGYTLIEGWTLNEAFYMTMISLTTVGYGEVYPLSPAGRLFTVALLLMGIGTIFYGTASIAEAIIEGRMRQVLGGRKRVREIMNLNGHHIVCGYGRIGFVVCRELEREGEPIVIIEGNAEKAATLNEAGKLVVPGDSTDDSFLANAGIGRAKSIICTLATDAENIFVTLSARSLNPSLTIVSRAARESSIPKMEAAGADHVISPYTMGGMRMAETLIRPKLVGFLSKIAGHTTADLDFDTLRVPGKSELVGQSLKNSRISQETRVNLIAVRRREGEMNFNPGPEFIIQAEDHLYALGHKDQVNSLRKFVDSA